MQQVIRKQEFEFKVNTAFEEVIYNCSNIRRKGMHGTWITGDVAAAYINLYKLGFAHSAETWQNGVLVGGLYGIKLGNVFFGESMFSKQSNASKYALISWVRQLQAAGIQLIDCQMHTPHLESLGARMIPRAHFIELLDKYTNSL